MNAGKVNFGLLLIIIGLAAFAVNIDLMDWYVYLDLLDLWPVLLVALGVQMIFRRTPIPQLAYVSSLLIAVVGGYVLMDNLDIESSDMRERMITTSLSDLDDNISRLVFDIDVDDCDLTIGGTDSKIAECRFRNFLTKPDIELETRTDHAVLTIDENRISGINIFDQEYALPEWDVRLYNMLPAELRLDCRDSDLRLNLEDIEISKLTARIPHSSMNVRFGSKSPEIDASMTVSRSEIRIRIPEGAGVEILDARSFNDYYVGDLDLTVDGSRLHTAGFDSASVRFSFDFSGNAKLLRLLHY